MGFGYVLKDLVTTSPNEKNRNMYKKLWAQIDKKIERLDQYINTCRENYDGFNTLYTDNGELYGKIIDKYNGFAKDSEKLISNEIDVLIQMRSSLSTASYEAEKLYYRYNQACIDEDEKGRNS